MIVVIAGLPLASLISFFSVSSHSSGTCTKEGISLVRPTACNCAKCAQLLDLHILYQVTKPDVFLHELHILSLNSLQVAHSVLELFVQFPHTTFI